MNTVDLEARGLGLRHLGGCPAPDRVEVYSTSRPGKPGPPARVAELYRTGRPTGRTFARGPALTGPATTVRVGRCQGCGAEAVREVRADG